MKTIFLALLVCLFPAGVFAQVLTETQKIDEFGVLYCCDFGARMNNAAGAQHANPGSQIYLVFYNGPLNGLRWNARLKKHDVGPVNPVRGEFRGFVAGAMKQIAFQRLNKEAFVIKDGGFRESLTVEIWIVPSGGAPPVITPTMDEKSIRYRKGRPHFSNLCDEM